MHTSTPRARLHPVLWIAAISVTALSLTGIGAITGWIPVAGAVRDSAPETAATAPAAAPGEAIVQTARVAAPEAAALAGRAVEPPEARVRSEPARHVPVAARALPETAPAPIEDAPEVPARAEPTVLAQAPEAAPVRCAECGTVESVREIRQAGEGTGLGAVAGGVLGGLLGHQIGKGRGNTVATVAGAVGGAVAGHQVERQVRSANRHEITVRMEDGSTRTVGSEGAPVWRAGDRVRVVDGRLLAAE